MITHTTLIDELESEFALADAEWTSLRLVDADPAEGDDDEMGGEDDDDPETMGGEDDDDPETMGTQN